MNYPDNVKFPELSFDEMSTFVVTYKGLEPAYGLKDGSRLVFGWERLQAELRHAIASELIDEDFFSILRSDLLVGSDGKPMLSIQQDQEGIYLMVQRITEPLHKSGYVEIPRLAQFFVEYQNWDFLPVDIDEVFPEVISLLKDGVPWNCSEIDDSYMKE